MSLFEHRFFKSWSPVHLFLALGPIALAACGATREDGATREKSDNAAGVTAETSAQGPGKPKGQPGHGKSKFPPGRHHGGHGQSHGDHGGGPPAECSCDDEAIACDDHNPCTDDLCNAGHCEHTPSACGTPCESDGVCHAGGSCGGGDGDSGVCDGHGACVTPGRPLWDHGYENGSARAVATDASGNIYVAGVFSNFIDFGTGPLTSVAGVDIFLAKFDASGHILWAKDFGGDAFDEFAQGVAVDGAGNVAITGVFQGTLDFGGGPLVAGNGPGDVFVAKFDPAGNHLWSKKFGDFAGLQSGRSIAADAAGDVAITGYFSGTVDFGGGPLTAAPDNYDAFVAKFDATGNHIFSYRLGEVGQQVGWDVAMNPPGAVAVTGWMDGTIDFGEGPLTSVAQTSSFVARWNPVGVLIFGEIFGVSGNTTGRGIAIDVNNEIVITGELDGTVDFGTGLLTSQGESDLYIAKLNPIGEALWSERFGAPGTFLDSVDVATDPSANIYATGEVLGTVDFGGGPLATPNNETTYVVSLAPDGSHRWSRIFPTNSFSRPFGIAAGACEEIVVGEFAGTINFGGGLRSSVPQAAYIAAFGP